MARAGLLHVTVIAATLLRDAGGSDIEPADTYASVGCGSQNFTTSSVKNHRAKPAWNESHTFKFDERSEQELQHILIEIFAEKPKLDELLGLAKIPLQTVIIAGDEISTHSLNRPHEQFTGQEKYSGHVKVALRWDAAKRVAVSAYPQAYTPAARYNPNVSLAKVHALSGQTPRSEDSQPCKSGEEQYASEDLYGAGQDRAVHHQPSSRGHSHRTRFYPSAPSSASQSPHQQPLNADDGSTPQQHFSNVNSQPTQSSTRPPSSHSSSEAPSNAPPQQRHGHGSSRQEPNAGPHVPYVSHEGNKVGKETSSNGQQAAGVQPTESGPANSNMKPDGTNGRMSKSKQAEMMKLAELSRLTQIATLEATGFAKAGQHASPHQQQNKGSSRPKMNNGRPPKPNPVPTNPRNEVCGAQQQSEAPQGPQKEESGQPLPQLTDAPQWQNPQSKQLSVVPTMLDIVVHKSQKQQRDEKPQRQPDVIYQKAIQIPEKEHKKKRSPFRQTLKILRKTSKIFGI